MIAMADALAAPLKSARGFAPSHRVRSRHGFAFRSSTSRRACSRQNHTHGSSVDGQRSAGFGQTVVQTGPAAATNPFRFSTKYLDRDTGLYYYGFRYYSPVLGRWLSRDPIEERGCINVYAHTANRPIDRLDNVGLDLTIIGPIYGGGGENAPPPIVISPPHPQPPPYLPPEVGSDSSCKCCKSLDDAMFRVTLAVRSGRCKTWFQNHGADGSLFPISCHTYKLPCAMGFPTWTMPGLGIGVCNNICNEDSAVLASLLIHEIAHHYCTWGPGREDCAISAQEACSDELIQ